MALADESADVSSVLAEASRRTEPHLRRTVGRLHPDLARIAGYHFGWSAPDGTPTPATAGGKSLRAALLLLAAEAYGADPQEAAAAAAAVELVHNWSMVHDDVIDRDAVRRGRATVWSVYGTGWAILAGDALLAAAQQCLLEAGGQGPATLRPLLTAVARLIDGQAGDISFAERPPAAITVEEYLAMAAGKTSALLVAAVTIGAGLGGARSPAVEALGRAAHHMGLAWQAANDIEDIWADPAATGKPPMGDLREHKPTLPLITALRTGSPEARTLAGQVREDGRWPGPERLAELIDKAGGRTATERLAAQHLARANTCLDAAALPAPTHRTIRRIFRRAVTRA